jgi:hypothetical protein
MGSKSRDKGARGELEIAAIIRDLTGYNVQRRVRQHDGDSDLEGIPGWSVEVKRHKTAARAEIRGWWDQACAQARCSNLPVLFYRRDRDDWRAVWSVAVHLGMQHASQWPGYEWTVEGSVDAWAAVMRDVAM